jgi:hypothetical protein
MAPVSGAVSCTDGAEASGRMITAGLRIWRLGVRVPRGAPFPQVRLGMSRLASALVYPLDGLAGAYIPQVPTPRRAARRWPCRWPPYLAQRSRSSRWSRSSQSECVSARWEPQWALLYRRRPRGRVSRRMGGGFTAETGLSRPRGDASALTRPVERDLGGRAMSTTAPPGHSSARQAPRICLIAASKAWSLARARSPGSGRSL